jgi:hypothetical protein
MEILLVYLYGIYDSIASLVDGFAFLSIFSIFVNGVIGGVIKDDVLHFKKYMYIKTAIFLVIVNVLIPPKEIAVAMVAAPTVVKTVNNIVDSNRTAKMVSIIDLSLDKVIKKLEEK